MNKYEKQYQKDTKDDHYKFGADVYIMNYNLWLEDRLSECDQEYCEACEKEIAELKEVIEYQNKPNGFNTKLQESIKDDIKYTKAMIEETLQRR